MDQLETCVTTGVSKLQMGNGKQSKKSKGGKNAAGGSGKDSPDRRNASGSITGGGASFAVLVVPS